VEDGHIKLPFEIINEVLAGRKNDEPLLDWITDRKDALTLKEEVDPALANKVVVEGYGPDLKDDELIEIGQDPFLIAYALAIPTERCVVTVEVSSPGKKRQNRKIPDVCEQFGIQCQNPFQVYRALGFKTGWKQQS